MSGWLKMPYFIADTVSGSRWQFVWNEKSRMWHQFHCWLGKSSLNWLAFSPQSKLLCHSPTKQHHHHTREKTMYRADFQYKHYKMINEKHGEKKLKLHIYTHLYKHMYIIIYTQQKRASTNLCTGKKYTICGGNKFAHVLL